MRINRITPFFICFLFFANISQSQNDSIYWPEINKEAKTWTRWWWMGSAVNKKNITRSLIAFEKAGIGGVEIEPIYGVKGQDKNFIDYNSLNEKNLSKLNEKNLSQSKLEVMKKFCEDI